MRFIKNLISIFIFQFFVVNFGYAASNYDDCILENMKNADNPRAADHIAAACASKFQSNPPPAKRKNNAETILTKKEPDSGVLKFARNSDRARVFVNKVEITKRRDYEYDFQETIFEVMNRNSFGISKVLIGITESESCKNDISSFLIIYECKIEKGHVISENSGGSINCGRQITQAVCVFGFFTEYLVDRKAFIESLSDK